MSLFKDEDDFWYNAKTGDWCFINNEDYIAIRFNNEEFGIVILPIKPQEGKVCWNWNNDRELPTLSPSIRVWGKGDSDIWHGYLRDGKLEVV